MGKRRGAPELCRTWHEGPVDRAQEHFEIWMGDFEDSGDRTMVARVLVTPIGPHTVQFFADNVPPADRTGIFQRLQRNLDFYLVELREPNVLKYMRYHARNSAATVYSEFHWDLIAPAV